MTPVLLISTTRYCSFIMDEKERNEKLRVNRASETEEQRKERLRIEDKTQK